jgi:integrase
VRSTNLLRGAEPARAAVCAVGRKGGFLKAQRNGSVVYNKNKGSWNLLWWQDGKRRSKLLGTILQFPTREDAEQKAEPLRRLLRKPHQRIPTVAMLVEQYRMEKMPERPSTRRGYEIYFKNHILPRWGELPITEMKPRLVELWLKTLSLAPKSKAHIRGLLRIIWEFAMFSDVVPVERNPMELVTVKGASKPLRRTRSLTVEQFQQLLQAVGDDSCWRTMLLVSVSFGLRISEVLGLKWRDVDWLSGSIMVERGVVKQIVGT